MYFIRLLENIWLDDEKDYAALIDGYHKEVVPHCGPGFLNAWNRYHMWRMAR